MNALGAVLAWLIILLALMWWTILVGMMVAALMGRPKLESRRGRGLRIEEDSAGTTDAADVS